nr:MAG TPA: hypothetical protein [Caudoviricetes sp.]DAS96925.1 MAG TPA: hypothetical protein [Caudoviricetes sp.]DAT85849.1 MAG TPA: hypothetical protein [Caudoviricetes sp.]DAX63195.1 MAG TPA: hypothetical protein [Caudoviricetes sp.]
MRGWRHVGCRRVSLATGLVTAYSPSVALSVSEGLLL